VAHVAVLALRINLWSKQGDNWLRACTPTGQPAEQQPRELDGQHHQSGRRSALRPPRHSLLSMSDPVAGSQTSR
jgi:hypothetical protein